MDDRKEIQKIMEQLFSKEQGREFTDNLRETEQMFEESPAPQPGSDFTDVLKAEVSTRLKRKRARKTRRVIYRFVSTAAAIILFAVILTNFPQMQNGQTSPDTSSKSKANILSDKIWESSNLSEDDPELSSLSFEVQQVQSEFADDNADESTGSNAYQQELSQIEVSYIEINNEFWKGR